MKTGTEKLRGFCACVILTFLSSVAFANSPHSTTVCDQVATRVAAETNVPLSVLRSITRTETGRSRNGVLMPWPWTVNMEGIGKWFDSEAEAKAYVSQHFNRGARSFDVGCFQINYRWHGAAFSSPEAMFDPLENARYAAGFLKRLHAEFGDWSLAAGAFHSRTPEFAARYRRRFDRIRQKLAASGDTHTQPIPRQNHFPLLQQSTTTEPATARLGSLVPLVGSGGALIPLPTGS